MSDKKFTFIGVTDELKASFKDLLTKFNVTPTPVAPAPVVAATPAPVAKFGEGKLKDGTVVKWDGEAALAVGTPVMVIDPANPEGFLPAPDGSLEFEDGSVAVIVAGIVTEYTPAEIVAPVVPPVEPGMTAQISQLREDLEALKLKFSTPDNSVEVKLQAEIETLKTALDNSNKTVKEMFELFGKAMDTPTADPIEAPKVLSKKDKMLQNIFN